MADIQTRPTRERKELATRETAPEKEKVSRKVVTGNVKVKEHSGHKLGGLIRPEDVKRVKDYLLKDVFEPMVKKMLYEGIIGSAEIAIFGENRGRGRSTRSDGRPNYRDRYDDRHDSRSRDREERRERFDPGSLEFEYRGDAERVLDRMHEQLRDYRYVTVGDMYDFADKTAPFTADKYGWTNLDKARVARFRDMYYIDLPAYTQLERG